jgi:hypothetical protein
MDGKKPQQLGGCLYGWAWRLILRIFCRLNLKNLGVQRMKKQVSESLIEVSAS